MPDRPNIVWVVMDTARAGDVTTRTAPAIHEIARRGTSFRRTFASAPWTLPSHASMFTGLYPSKHGAHADHEQLSDDYPTIASLLRGAGYETVGISNNTWITPESGFGQGFETFHRAWQYVQSSEDVFWEMVQVRDERTLPAVLRRLVRGNPIANAVNALYGKLRYHRTNNGAVKTTKWIEDWHAERSDSRPFFLFANFIDPHLEYRPPKELAARFLPEGVSFEEAMEIPQSPWEYLVGDVEYSEEELAVLRALYRGEIAYVDEQIDRIRRTLVAAGEWEDTVMIVCGDHGENIGDHGLMDHQYCLYDTLLRVPLVVGGGAFEGGGDVDDMVSLVDLPPTLLDVANVDAPEARAEFQGRSIHPDAGTSERDRIFAEYMAPQPSMEALERKVGPLPEEVYKYDRSLRAVRTDEYKFVRGSDGARELYHVAHDPDESTNLADERRSTVRDLETRLDEWLDSFDRTAVDGSVSIDDARKARLEELGYLQ